MIEHIVPIVLVVILVARVFVYFTKSGQATDEAIQKWGQSNRVILFFEKYPVLRIPAILVGTILGIFLLFIIASALRLF